MTGHKRHRIALFALAVWAAAALLAACGDVSKKSTLPATDSGQTSAVAGLSTCATCHTVVATEWLAGGHANLGPGATLDSPGNPALAQISTCTVNCHDPNADSGTLTAAGYLGNVPRPVVGCEACHGNGSLHAEAGGAGPIAFATKADGSIGATAVSAQFNTCTTCHELLDTAGTGTTTTASHDAGGSDPRVAPEGVSANKNSITDTHFAKPGTYGVNGRNTSPVSGYAMDFASPTVCSDCHNPHGTADINRDWALAKHGDRSVNAWSRSNWSCDGTDPVTCGPTATSAAPLINDLRYCQRCHTKTGFAAYADAIRTGNTALFTALDSGVYAPGIAAPLPFTREWKPEMNECGGCHIDNRGHMRNPGPFTATYDYRTTPVGSPSGSPATVYANASFQYPDLGASNVCILCHSGRTNGATIKNLNTQPTATVDFRSLKAADGHHDPVAATMFKGLGYEFSGRSYENPLSYRHFEIGTAAVPNTGTNGPCVGCHMFRSGRAASHLFTAVSKSGSTVTAVSSEVCYQCHEGSSASLASVVDAERLALTYALGVFSNRLITANAVHPILNRNTINWLAPGDTDASGNTTGKNNLGAYFNFASLNGNEMGAYLHNSTYTKRLIYDSIDWVDDGELNYSVGTTLAAVCSTATATCSTAMTYLLPSGVNPGAPSERPF